MEGVEKSEDLTVNVAESDLDFDRLFDSETRIPENVPEAEKSEDFNLDNSSIENNFLEAEFDSQEAVKQKEIQKITNFDGLEKTTREIEADRPKEKEHKNTIKQEIEEIIAPFGYMLRQSLGDNKNIKDSNKLQVIQSEFEDDRQIEKIVENDRPDNNFKQKLDSDLENTTNDLGKRINDIDNELNDLGEGFEDLSGKDK